MGDSNVEKDCRPIFVRHTEPRYIHGTDIEIQGTITRTPPGCPSEASMLWQAFLDLLAGRLNTKQ